MDTLIPGIRNAVRAVIVRGDSLLVQQKLYEDGSGRLTLPGGAPDLGETLEAALRRECAEELGAQIRVFELLHVADYFKPRDSDPPTRRQQVEFLFRCEVPDSDRGPERAKTGQAPGGRVLAVFQRCHTKPIVSTFLERYPACWS